MAQVNINIGNDVGQTWTLTDSSGEILASSYGNAVVRNLQPETYTLTWSVEQGYEPPVPAQEVKTLGASETHTFTTPVYSVGQNTGTIVIEGVDSTTGNDAGWSLAPDPGNGNQTGTGNATFEAPVGSYTITWQDNIAEHDPPAPDTDTLSTSGTLTFAAPTYVKETGTIEIVNAGSVPADFGWTLTGPSYPDGLTSAGNATLTADVGDYTLVWSDSFLEYEKPADPAPGQTLTAGTPLTFTADYTLRGTFSVTVQVDEPGGTPDDFGAWTITNDEGLTLSNDLPFSASGDKLDNGSPVTPDSGDFYVGRNYTLVFSPEGGYSLTGGTQSISSAGTYTGTYTVQAAATVQVSPTVDLVGTVNDNATWTLYGPGGFEYKGTGEETVDVASAGNGDYWVRWGWMYDYWPPVAHSVEQVALLANIGVTVDAPAIVNGTWGDPNHRYPEVQTTQEPYIEPWSSQSQNIPTDGSSLSFSGLYTARTPDKSKATMGVTLEHQDYYRDVYMTADRMAHRSYDFGWGVGNSGEEITWPSTGTSTTRVQIHAPGQWRLPQGGEVRTFRVYWKGQGTITLQGVGDITLPAGDDSVWNAPGVTFQARVYPQQINADGFPEEFGTSENQFSVSITPSAPAPNHLREVQIVAEEYVCPEGENPNTYDGSPGKEPLHWITDLTGNYLSEHGKQLAQNTRVWRFLDHLMRINRNDDKENGDSSSNPIYHGDPKNYRCDPIGPGRAADEQAHQKGHSNLDAIQQYIDLCNAGECDMWICFPWQGGDPHLHWPHPFYEVIIDQIEKPYTGRIGGSGLNPNLRVFVEWGNEQMFSPGGQQPFMAYWTRWYTNNATDHAGQAYPFGQRGSKHPGFDDQFAFPSTGETWQYQSFRTWKIYEQIKDKLETRGGVNPYTSVAWNAKVPGEYASLFDRYQFVISMQASTDDPKGRMPHYREREDIGGGTLRPSYTTPFIKFDGVTDFKDIISYQGAAYYDNGPTWKTLLFNGYDADGRPESAWEQDIRDYFKKWHDIDATTDSVFGWAGDPPKYKEKQAYKRWYQEIRDNTGIPGIVGYEGGPLGQGYSSWKNYQTAHTHPWYYGVSFDSYKNTHVDTEMDLPVHFNSPRWHKLDPTTGPWGLKQGSLQREETSMRFAAFVDFTYLYPRDPQNDL